MHEKELNPVGGVRVGRNRGAALLRQGLLLLLLAPSAVAMSASAAEAGATQSVCPALLLEHECRAYQADLTSAVSAAARNAIKARYEGLLFERERACYCNAERAWIRLTETATHPQSGFHHISRSFQDTPRIRL